MRKYWNFIKEIKHNLRFKKIRIKQSRQAMAKKKFFKALEQSRTTCVCALRDKRHESWL